MTDLELKLRDKINLETGRINWLDLQTFYARGQVILVSVELDLVEVASELSHDNKKQFKKWLAENKITYVTDHQALDWYENKKDLWAVVIMPWVLVQDKDGSH